MYSVRGEKHKVVRIPDVVCGLEGVLHELIKLIHIDVDEELGGEVAEGEALASCTGVEAGDDTLYECTDAFIGYISVDDLHQYLLINGSEELLDVAFEYPAGFRIVL
jgi:hypothetical protein